MLSLLSLTALTIFVSVLELRQGEAVDDAAIRCEIPCNGNQSTVQIGGGFSVTVSATHVNRTTWPDEKDSTASRPEQMDTTYYIQNKRRIVLEVRWKHKIPDIQDEMVDGYYLKYWRSTSSSWKLKVNLTVEKTKEDKTESKTHTYIQFVYSCIGRKPTIFIKPKEMWTFRLFSMPLHQLDTKPQSLEGNIRVPDCCDDEKIVHIRNSDISNGACKRCWKDRLRWLTTSAQVTTPSVLFNTSHSAVTTKEYTKQADNTMHYVVAYVIIAFLSIIIIIFITLIIVKANKLTYDCARSACTNEANVHRDKVPENILMVADARKAEDLEMTYSLVARLRQRFEVKITFNLERQRVIEERALNWYMMQLSDSDLVVFIMNRRDFVDQIRDDDNIKSGHSELLQVFNHVMNLKKAESVSFAFLLFGDDTIQLSGFWTRQRYPFKIYETANAFESFLTRVIGKNNSEKKQGLSTDSDSLVEDGICAESQFLGSAV